MNEESLNHLYQLRQKTIQLNSLKCEYFENLNTSNQKKALAIELSSERNSLINEKNKLLEFLFTIQKDIDNLAASEEIVRNQQKESTQEANQLLAEYTPLKDEVDAMRSVHGLPALPSMQEEIDKANAEMLNERMKQNINSTANSQTTSVENSPAPSSSLHSIKLKIPNKQQSN